MTTLKTIGSGLFGLVLGGLLVWAHMSDLVELCRSEAASVQAEIHEAEQARDAVAARLIEMEQERSQAYDWLAAEVGKRVDLTIPFKPIKAEQVSQVQIETNEITALAKFGTKIENKLKHGFMKLATGMRP